MKKIIKAPAFMAVAIGFVALLLMGATERYVTNLGILQLDQNELRNSSGVAMFYSGSSRLTVNGPVSFGNAISTASITLPSATTGSRFSTWVPVYNPTASTLAAGTVLIASNTGAGYVNISPATIDVTNVVGVAATDIPTLTKGFMVPRGGGYAVVLTTGTITVGDVLVTSGTLAGRFGFDNTPTTGADVGIAMTAGAAAGDSVLAILQ